MEELARSITLEHGKLIAEAHGEVRRAIENVDMACCTPVLLQGRTAEDISAGVDEALIPQPVGVCAAIVPFNFPLMIPCWFPSPMPLDAAIRLFSRRRAHPLYGRVPVQPPR